MLGNCVSSSMALELKQVLVFFIWRWENSSTLKKNSLEQNRELANTYGVGSGMERREDEFPQHYVNPFEKIELLIKKKSFSFPSFIFFMFFGSSYSLEQDNEVERIWYTRSLNLIRAINILGLNVNHIYRVFLQTPLRQCPAIFLLYMDISNNITTRLALSCNHITWRIWKHGIMF